MLSFVSQEAYIAELDAKSGASLKLTILNKKGRIWTMVAGGGASVIYAWVCVFEGVNFSSASDRQINSKLMILEFSTTFDIP